MTVRLRTACAIQESQFHQRHSFKIDIIVFFKEIHHFILSSRQLDLDLRQTVENIAGPE
jgi:hypothetical protein